MYQILLFYRLLKSNAEISPHLFKLEIEGNQIIDASSIHPYFILPSDVVQDQLDACFCLPKSSFYFCKK